MVPYPRNPQFTGREDVLTQLETALLQSNAAVLTQPQAIRGLGGIGKTQTAVEYAYRHRNAYSAVFWVKAELREELMTGFGEIAKVLQLPQQDAQDQSVIITAVKEWFKTHERWLLIVDNADDLTVAREFLPSSGQGHVLLTTRAAATGQIAQAVELKKMSHHDGALFLLRRAKRIADQGEWENATEADQKVALEIAQEMDGLPLALDQAGAYVEEMMLSLTEYLNLYRQEGAKLLAERGELATDDHLSVTVTFRLAFTKVQERSPAAADLLRVCAFLAPDDIPEEIFTAGASVLAEPLRTVAANALDFRKAVQEAGRFSLIERNSSTQTLNIHRLVQEVLRDKMETATRHDWLEQTIKAVNQVFPDPEFNNWSLCDRLLPHVISLASLKGVDTFLLVEVGLLFSKVGGYLLERGLYSPAQTFLSKSCSILDHLLEPDDLLIGCSLNNLAQLYRAQGHYKEAEPLYVRALTILENQLGLDHAETATILNNFASLYRAQGRYLEAETLYRRSLSIQENQLGPNHPSVAIGLNNLSLLYTSQGRYEEAEPLYKRSLSIQENQLGSDHPDIATGLNNLAELYRVQGRYEEAEPLYIRSLTVLENQLGPDHCTIASILSNLAVLYHVQGQKHYAKAELLFTRSLNIQEQQLGSDHPAVANTCNNLAALYKSQGHYVKAELLFTRSLTIQEQQLGSDHPAVATSLSNLAGLHRIQNQCGEAEKLYKRSLEIDRSCYGENHDEVAVDHNNLAGLYHSQRRYREAETHCVQALLILFQSLGQEHPNTKTGLQNFRILLAQVLLNGQQNVLSKHPFTQKLLAQIQANTGSK
jgi:tetratricopeptide (TPR) repeat protein